METRLMGVDEAGADKRLRAELGDLLAPSYVDADLLLDREFENNTNVYLLANEGRVAAFFMVGWERPRQIGGEPATYLGLSACREEAKGRGHTIRLYRRFIKDALAREVGHQRRMLLWGTTAHPVIWSVLHHFFRDVSPRVDGTYAEDAGTTAWNLRGALGRSYAAGPHPFVLPGAAGAVRYSGHEAARCDRARGKLALDPFTLLGADERRGDRILFLCRLPAEQSGEPA